MPDSTPDYEKLIAEARQLTKLHYVAMGPGTKECLAECADAIKALQGEVARWKSAFEQMRDAECIECNEIERIDRLKDEVARLTRERDEAIAHDRQPYPTVEAYEKACAALHKHEACADAAEEVAEQMRQAVELRLSTYRNSPDFRFLGRDVAYDFHQALAAKLTGEVTRLRTQRAAIIKAWDAWYDGPETRVPNELVEAIVALKEAE